MKGLPVKPDRSRRTRFTLFASSWALVFVLGLTACGGGGGSNEGGSGQTPPIDTAPIDAQATIPAAQILAGGYDMREPFPDGPDAHLCLPTDAAATRRRCALDRA